jgi:hypothetical protein
LNASAVADTRFSTIPAPTAAATKPVRVHLARLVGSGRLVSPAACAPAPPGAGAAAGAASAKSPMGGAIASAVMRPRLLSTVALLTGWNKSGQGDRTHYVL